MKALNLKEILELPVGSKLAVEVKSTTDIFQDDFFYCKLLSVANERVELALEILRGVESFHRIDLELIQETLIHNYYCDGITEQISIDESAVDRIYSINRPYRKKQSSFIPIQQILANQNLRVGAEYNNTNCRYNAQSAHLKCAVNPKGSCDGCKDFEATSDGQRISEYFFVGEGQVSPIGGLMRSEPEQQIAGRGKEFRLISRELSEPLSIESKA
jgi:Family of unknown function (DUF6464)